MTVVDIYCRTACLEQGDTTPLDQQEAACRAYCDQHGLSIGLILREVVSGYTYREREGLTHLRHRYRAGETQGVVVANLDRLSRSQVHRAALMEEMDASGASLHVVRDPLDDSPMGKFIRAILTYAAEVEQGAVEPNLYMHKRPH
jgi:DNA invertase Pin-like site-specific DNA recombinase